MLVLNFNNSPIPKNPGIPGRAPTIAEEERMGLVVKTLLTLVSLAAAALPNKGLCSPEQMT